MMPEGPFKAAVVRGRPFAAGTSPNPGGKPKTAEISALARRYTVDAIRGLVAVARLEASKHDSAVTAACKALIDLGYPGHQKAGFGDSEGGNVLHLHLLAVSALGAPQATHALAQLPAAEPEGCAVDIPIEDEAGFLPEGHLDLPDEALPLWDAQKSVHGLARTAPEAKIVGNVEFGTPPVTGFGE